MYDLATPWTTAYQAPPSMGFSRQEYWSGVPLPSPTRLLCPWDFPGTDTGMACHFLLQRIFQTQRWKPRLLCWQADSFPLSHLGSLIQAQSHSICLFVTVTGERNGSPLQYLCQEKSMDRGAWWAPWGRKESDTTERLTLCLMSLSVMSSSFLPS